MGRFEGKTAIVTGAAGGIGAVVVSQLRDEGATVVATDLRDGDGIGVVGDISDPATADRLVEAAGGRVDVLVNNAGVFEMGPAEDFAHESWRRAIDVNLSSYFYVAQAAGKVMIAQRSGSIVNVASTAGVVGVVTAVAYNASKHGVVGLTKALAMEWARYGIRVNALCPGLTYTEMAETFERSDPERYADRLARIPMGRAASAEEQAKYILHLASDDASYVTGQAMVVDGGTVALSSGFAAPPMAPHV